MADEYAQTQINRLQDNQAVHGAKLDALHKRVDKVEAELRQIPNAAQVEQIIENSFNRQFVRGFKYMVGGIGAFLLAIWTDVVNWISR